MARSGERCFVFMHLFDPHSPYFFLKGRPWWRENQEYEARLGELFEPRGLRIDDVMRQARREAEQVVADFSELDEYNKVLEIFNTLLEKINNT